MNRVTVSALAFSLVGFTGLAGHEYYVSQAMIPVKGDRPTVGFGSTFRDDGSPVQMGDTITPVQAIKRTQGHIAKDESKLKQCVKAPLFQHEYDLLVDHAYQYGVAATCSSKVVELTNQGKYQEACQAYLNWKRVGTRDCSVRSNGCYGVWLRSQARTKTCMEGY